jgi:hypothetical protein
MAQARSDGASGAKRTGGKFGRIPKYCVLSPGPPEVTFLIAYRSLHVDGRAGWGCNHKKMAETVRAGFSL